MVPEVRLLPIPKDDFASYFWISSQLERLDQGRLMMRSTAKFGSLDEIDGKSPLLCEDGMPHLAIRWLSIECKNKGAAYIACDIRNYLEVRFYEEYSELASSKRAQHKSLITLLKPVRRPMPKKICILIYLAWSSTITWTDIKLACRKKRYCGKD